MSLKAFLLTYLLGGVTFIPIIIISLLYLNGLFSTQPKNEEETTTPELLSPPIDPKFKAGKYEEKTGVDVSKNGWISVTNQYYYHFTEVNELGLGDNANILTRAQLRKRQRFFTVLREGNLFLYRDDSPNSSLLHAISLKDVFVSIWPRVTTKQEPLLDASLFTKKTCIALFRNGSVTLKSDGKTLEFASNNIRDVSAANQETVDLKTSNANQFYLYFDNNMDKEDWYFELINAAKNTSDNNKSPLNPNVSAETAHINTADMLYLIQTINSTQGQLTTKWLNALLGRLFLSLQETDALNQALLDKVYKKLSKINKPGFFDEFVIEKVDVGNSVPFLMNPRLSELSPEGSMKLLTDLTYKGSLEIIISTKVNINLGSHFKPREVALQLSIKVKEITGPLEVLFKPPPSNRIWYAFESEPILDLDIEPIVSSSKLSYNVITNVIKGKFAEAIKESLVVPFYDDIVYFTTPDEFYRGGIWSKNPMTPDKTALVQQETLISEKSNVSDDMNEVQEEEMEAEKGRTPSERLKINTMKTKTLEKVDSLKQSIRSSKQSFELRVSDKTNDVLEGMDNNSIDSNSESVKKAKMEKLTEQSTKSKVYIKNSLSKINKWYKEAVNTNENDGLVNDSVGVGEPLNENDIPEEPSMANLATGSAPTIEEQPKMISNRRTTKRKTSQTGLRSPVLGPGSDVSESAGETSPVVVATEMFGNKQRSISISSNKTKMGSNNQFSQFASPKTNDFY